MTEPPKPDRPRVYPWVIGVVVIGLMAYGTVRFTTAMRSHTGDYSALLKGGEAAANTWLAEVRADPDAAYATASAAFRAKVTAAEWAAFVAANPPLRTPGVAVKMVSVGGGSVAGGSFDPTPTTTPPRGHYRDAAAGVEVWVAVEDGVIRVDAVAVGGAALPAAK
jgi:hypothetical protein